ncbi:MAG: spermidine/putrescine ABC transporter substrate-binding protein [Chloroflexi bacterium]|nr:spermidine/putrescine ABC transporter substrate-binding protein [Chloroflexota bacterium]
MQRTSAPLCIALYAFLLLTGCSTAPAVAPTPTPPPLASTITLHNWDGGMPQSILDAFTAEYGVAVEYLPYAVYEEAQSNLEAGTPIDVLFVGTDVIAETLSKGLLAELDPSNLPNLRNVSVNFRDLSFDPGNRHSIPLGWGTTGLVVRSDLFGRPVTSWRDLWEGETGQIGIWDDRRSIIGLTLRSLGYSVNSEDPDELEAALERMLELRPRALFMEQFDPWTSAPEMDSGRIVIALGWAYDGLAGRDLNPNIEYVIPQEGTLLWLENMVIPANSPNKATAELFINFMLRPEIAAQYVNETYYAVANEAAKAFVDPAILDDPIVYPTAEQLVNAELMLPLSAEARMLYDSVWDRFLAASAGSE